MVPNAIQLGKGKTVPRRRIHLLCVLFAFMVLESGQAADFYVSLSGGSLPPYGSWASAATNIQDAIDTASAGDVVWVTNGIYRTGGKSMAADLTNRIVLDKPLIVQSLNGPAVTIILGEQHYAVGLVRCAWLTNGAVLSGFTLRWGSASGSGDLVTLMSGGAVWCSDANAIVTNCTIFGSRAASGGGAYGGTLKNVSFIGNTAWSLNGGGASHSTLINCAVVGNSASANGGGTDSCFLTNCTVVRNSCSASGGGCYFGQAVNSIVYFNSDVFPQYANYYNCSMQYSCSTPMLFGTGDISGDPQFLADGLHIPATSPCRSKGNSAYVSGLDIDGQPWAAPPSMGCDEWHQEPAILYPAIIAAGTRFGEAGLSVSVVGQEPIVCWWNKDGTSLDDSAHYAATHTTNLLVRGFGPGDGGFYQMTASNAYGMSTSAVIQVCVHCADATGSNPVSPFATWQTAATNIQDAAGVAMPGDVVVATNGVYNSGGASMDADLTNRVEVNYQTMVMSVNGPQVTVLEGQRDAVTTNGPSAVRCAYVAGTLSGFTLQNGATRASGFSSAQGGGVYALGGTVAFCVLSNNAAAGQGGGVYRGTVINCILANNWSGSAGGGAAFSKLSNCYMTGNSAASQGGGCYLGTLNNCTVTYNSSPSSGSGTYSCTLTNSLVYFNLDSSSGSSAANYASGSMQYCCSLPLAPGLGNISSDPQIMDGAHIGAASPCRNAGMILSAIGTDLDGEAWASPPSIGCDEVMDGDFSGQLAVGLATAWAEVAVRGSMPLIGHITGRAARVEWSFGNGVSLTNGSSIVWYSWTNTGDYTVTFTAFNADHPLGVSSNLLVHVIPLIQPSMTLGGLSLTNFSLSFQGQPGVSYLMDRATNLLPPITWESFRPVFGTGTLQVLDSNATNIIEFYRVRIP